MTQWNGYWTYLMITTLGAALLAACAGAGVNSHEQITVTAPDCSVEGSRAEIAPEVPAWFKEHFTCVKAWVEGEELVVETRSLPPYPSYYYGRESSRYKGLPAGRRGNPNRIKAQAYRMRIPLRPKPADDFTDTEFDAIGVAINGVVMFNNQAAPGDTLSDEIATMDGAMGHPTPHGIYHYHTEPLRITRNDGALVGVLRDGFPVYGKKEEDGSAPAGLDRTNGHAHPKRLFPGGIHHYHVTEADPYIASSYRGTPGKMIRSGGGGRRPPRGPRGPGLNSRPPRGGPPPRRN